MNAYEYLHGLHTISAYSELEPSELDVEIRLRYAALERYSDCLAELEEAGADYNEQFTGVEKDWLGNLTVECPECRADLNFSFAVNGVDWSFGALEVLNRRTVHNLESLSPRLEDWKGHLLYSQGSQDPAASRSHRKFVNAALVATRARAKLEREARFSSQRRADLAYLGEPAEPERLRASVDIDAALFDPSLAMPSSQYSLQWTASGRSDAAERAARFARMAARPLFEAFPPILLPARMRVLPDEGMSQDALLVTAAAWVDLPPWGFSAPAGAGGRDEDDSEIRVHLARAPASRGRRRATEGGAQEAVQPAALSCPTGIWDEAPSDIWHPLARRMARDIWARHESAMLAARFDAAAAAAATGA